MDSIESFANEKVVMLEMVSGMKSRIFSDKWNMYTYEDINEVQRKELLNFDPYFNADKFVAIYTTAIFGAADEGIVFTTDGIYFNCGYTMYFINYADIASISSKKGFFGVDFIFTLTTGEDMTYSVTWCEDTACDVLPALLSQLKTFTENVCPDAGSKLSGEVDSKVKVEGLTQDETIKCNAIIHTASVAAGGVATGLAQLPLADAAIITPIQITMITSLGLVFGIDVDESAAKAVVAGLGAAYAGRAAVQIFGGWIPGLGNIINASTAVALTEAVGWAAVSNFKGKQDAGWERVKGVAESISHEYEKKLRKQAQDFIQRTNVCENEREEFMKLIGEYQELLNQRELAVGVSGSGDLKNEFSALASLPVLK